MQKAIIIGASSGIGRELALILARKGYAVCATARRRDLLEKLNAELPSASMTRKMDASDPLAAASAMEALISEIGPLDLVVISAGTGHLNPHLEWSKEKQTIDLNVTGFAAIAGVAYQHFIQREAGHLVAVSSLAALRGGADAPAYNASKAFMASYLQGLRHRVAKLGVPIHITDIRPGFVDTAMAKGEGLFWVQSPQKAARQIYGAIRRKRKVAYITKRWRMVAWMLKVLPDAIYHRM